MTHVYQLPIDQQIRYLLDCGVLSTAEKVGLLEAIKFDLLCLEKEAEYNDEYDQDK